MSSEIIYHQTVIREPAAQNGLGVDLYFWLWQIGSSNCYEVDHHRPGGVGRRSRSWQMASFGTREQVMRTAIYFSGDCEGGMLKLRSNTNSIQPEALIRSVRRMIAQAEKADAPGARDAYAPLFFRLKRSARGDVDQKSYEHIADFFADHPQWLSQNITNACGYASVTGPRL